MKKRRKGQGRITEAILAVALLISFMLALNFIAPMQLHSIRRTSYYELRELTQSLYQCLETTGALETILTTQNPEFQRQLLNQLVTALLPPGTYYNITIEKVTIEEATGIPQNPSIILTISNMPAEAKEECEAATIRAMYTPITSEITTQQSLTTYIIYITLYRVTE